MPRLKILYINPTGFLGGAEMCLLDLLATLGPAYQPKVILCDDGPLRQEVERLGVPCDVLPFPDRLARLGDSGISTLAALRLIAKMPGASLAAWGYLRLLRNRIRAEAPDLLQTNGMKAHLLGSWAAPKGVPVVWHLHDYVSGRGMIRQLLRSSIREGLKVVAVSRSVAVDASKTLGESVPIIPILNAVDLNRFSPGPGDGARLDAEAGQPDAPGDVVRIGLVATYARWKGHLVFLEAVARLPHNPGARFYIIGSPLYRSVGSQWSIEELRGMVEKLGIADRIGFIPHRSDPENLYRALDVVVHASTRPEPFGRVIVEAMACGRAVVAVPEGGAAELFTEGVSGMGFPPGNSQALAEILTRLIKFPELRARIGEAARRESADRFDRTRLTEEWAWVYEMGRAVPSAADLSGP